jgi:virulence factor Mce-like protein
MRARGTYVRDVFSSPILVGTMILAVGLIGVLLSYNANRGLPYVPVYEISIDVPDAAELVRGGSEVRVDGARVGLVKDITPEPGRRSGQKAFARIKVSLDKELEAIPADSRVQVRPRSILGAKFLDLRIGHSKKTIPAGGVLAITQAQPIVELDEAFNVFDRETTRGIRSGINSLGDALAGRGSALNEGIGAAGHLMAPLQRVTRTVVDPSTDLEGFIRGIVEFNQALEPVAGTLGSLFDRGATTLAAIDAAGDSLGRAIAELPATETTGTRALLRLRPVLDDATAIVTEIRPGTRLLPSASRRIAAALVEGTKTVRDRPGLGNVIRSFARVTRAIDTGRASAALRDLVAAVQSLGTALKTINPSQTQCNAGGLFMRNVPSMLSDGDADGAWLTAQVVINAGQMLQSAAPSPDLHVNVYPNETLDECETGNEPFLPGQQLGNPPGKQSNRTELTYPPADAHERAERAGLLKHSSGARP